MKEKNNSLIELAENLRLRSHISEADATNFVKTFVEVIEQNLLKDNIVKIKGFGTFKLMTVDGRESIDVNTGKRILIEAHGKVTFNPDAVLRDAVNKPFADFTTVVLNDDTPTEVMDAEEVQEEDILQEETSQEEDVLQEETSQEEDVLQEDEAESTNDAPRNYSIFDAALNDGENYDDDPLEDKPESSSDEKKGTRREVAAKHEKKCWWIFACAVCLLVGFVIADLAHLDVCHSVKECVVDIISPTDNSNVENNVSVMDEKSTDTTTAVAVKVVEAAPVDSSSFYPQLDNGEYRIVGVLAKEKMRSGTTLMQFSRTYYGSQNYVEYITLMNHVENPDLIPLNAEIIIPKLELKNKQ